MSNMADACQSLPSKTIGTNRCKILKSLELGCCKPLAKDGEVIFLIRSQPIPKHSDSGWLSD